MTAVEIVAGILAEHSTFAWNRSLTRIRCVAACCGAVMDAADGTDAILMFARHQAEQLPAPAVALIEDPDTTEPANDPGTAEESIPAPLPAPEPVIEPADLPEPTDTSPDEPDTNPEGPAVETALIEPAPEASDLEAPAPAKKIRRDTKALGATIAEIKSGDRVAAFFNHPRYGEFAVEGTVIKGGAGQDRNQLMVGGWYINLNERAAKCVQDLVIIATAGNHEFDIPKPSEANEHVGIGG